MGDLYPPWLSSLLAYYHQTASGYTRIEIPAIPRSVNSQYVRTRNGMFLHKDIRDFRILTKAACAGFQRMDEHGLVAAVIEFESPDWITKARTVRRMDVDNKIKSVLDAIEHAVGLRDELYWHIHVVKVVSKERKTVVHLFDIGDIVELIA